MKLYTLKRTQQIGRPLDETFSFFSRPENLARITPAKLKFIMLTPSPIEVKEGAVIDYTIRPFGFPLRWTTLITEYNAPHSFTDLQLRGPYSYWHHRHSFEDTDDGTLISDEVRYALPLGLLGAFAHSFIVRHQLETIFDFRSAALKRIFPDIRQSGGITNSAQHQQRETDAQPAP